MIDYNKRLVEVSIILNHLKKSDYDKIPKNVIKIIENNKDTTYIWNYDETKDLKNQNVSKDTIAILSYINMQYLLNGEQRKFVENVFDTNQKKKEDIKKDKYNPDDIFKRKKEQEMKQTTAIVEYKEENIFRKILNKIKNFFMK